MASLAREAGFQQVEIIPTKGKPGVFATLDAGAATTLAIYFMYDVKQFDPSEWSSPPLEGRLVDRPGMGKVIVGRGATNTKGPQMACLAALHAFKAANVKLPINLVLVCEGRRRSAPLTSRRWSSTHASRRRFASRWGSSSRSATRRSMARSK